MVSLPSCHLVKTSKRTGEPGLQYDCLPSHPPRRNMHQDPPYVSVVLPVYNEAGHLEQEVDRIQAGFEASDYSFEIIVIDDASTDGSLEILKTLPGIRLVAFLTNHGPGAARRLGTELARGDVVVWTDADMSYPNELLPELVPALEGYDQVIGARTTEQGSLRFARFSAKWAIRRLAQYLSRTKIPDLNSGFRAFRRDVAEQFLHLFPRGMSHATTMTMAFLANGYSIRYVEIPYSKRAGRSKFHWYRDTRRYLQQVVRMIMMWNPIRVLMPIAMLLFVVGVGKMIFDVVDKNFRIGTNTLLIMTAAMVIGVLALLADLVSQVSRPQHPAQPAAISVELDVDGPSDSESHPG